MKKLDIYQYKATLLFVCCVVLIGAGACSTIWDGIQRMGDQRLKAIHEKNTKKSVPLFREIKARIDNNQATATDYYLFAEMIKFEPFSSEVGMAKLKKNEREKIYINYLKQAINKGNQEAKLDYAFLLYIKNINITDQNVTPNEKKAKYLPLKQSITLIGDVVNTQCQVYRRPYYREFYTYPKEMLNVKKYVYWFNWKNEKLKSDYPELYQQAKKIEKTYEENCKKDKP